MLIRSPFLHALLTLLAAAPVVAQEDGVRLGLSFGSTSIVAVVVELVEDGRGLELSVGTWSFRDVNVSLVGKGYLGASHLRPMFGAGLWAIFARPAEAERGGMALVARFPVGFDWRAGGDHFVDFEMSLSRGLYIRRSDPADTAPMNRRLVPLPGLSYRFQP